MRKYGVVKICLELQRGQVIAMKNIKKKEVYRKVGVCIKGNTNVCCEYDYNKVMQEVAINARK